MEKRSKTFSFAISLVAVTLDNLSVSGAMVSTTSVQKHFNASSVDATWVISAYALTLGSFILLAGKLADIVGPHIVFMWGTGFMALFSLICAVIENSIIALIVFRALQGIAGATLIPSGVALMGSYYGNEPENMGRANRAFLLSATGAFGLGTVLSGAFALTDIGYKAFFYFTFAVALIAFVLLLFFMVPPDRTEAHSNLKLADLNYAGVILFVGGCLLIILGLTEGGDTWKSPKAYITLPVGFLMVLSVIGFETLYIRKYRKTHSNQIPVPELKTINTTVETNTVDGTSSDLSIETDSNKLEDKTLSKIDWRLRMDYLFPPEINSIPNFYVFLIHVISGYISFSVLMTGLFQYHQFVDHDSTLISALKTFPLSVGIVTGAISYRDFIVKKIGTRYFLIICSIFELGSAIWFTRINFRVDKSYFKFEIISVFLHGLFINWFFDFFLGSVMSNTPTHLQGCIAGIYWTFGQLGLALGDGIFTSIVGSLGPVYSYDERKLMQDNIVKGLYLSVAVCAISLIVSIFAKDTDSKKEEPKTNQANTDIEQAGKN